LKQFIISEGRKFIPVFFKKEKIKKEKTEGKPPVHDQPERRSIIWIDSLTLISQDEDIDPINQSGLVVIHHGLLGSIPR